MNPESNQTKLLGSLEELVLRAIAHVAPEGVHGAAIQSLISDRTGRSVTVGALYATLDRLEEKGLIYSLDLPVVSAARSVVRSHFFVHAEGYSALQTADNARQAFQVVPTNA